MRAIITNFRGISKADLQLSGITLVFGPNSSGKSSIAHGLAAALSGNPIPLSDMKKTDAGMLVHAGTGKGGVVIETADGKLSVDYPQAKVKTQANPDAAEYAPPAASAFALGMQSLVDLDPKRFAATLIEYLRAAPTPEDIARAAKVIGLSDVRPPEREGKTQPSQIELLQQRVADLGWDGAYTHCKDLGVKMKGRWEGLTGERYGTSKADSWLPKGWATNLEGASEERLQADQTQAQEFLEAAIATGAVDEDRRAMLEQKAALAEEHRAGVDAAKDKLAEATAAASARKTELDGLPRPSASQAIATCPHCNNHVVIAGGKLEVPAPRDEAEDQTRSAAIKAAQDAYAKATTVLADARAAVSAVEAYLQAAETAAAELAAMPAPGGGADVERAREAQREAGERLAAFRSKREADSLHAGIGANAEVQAMLAPTGLRLTKLREAITAFNGRLVKFTKAAEWQAVEVADDMAVTYGGRPLMMLAENERFRVKAVLQLAMAEIDKSALCVIDAADILDKAGRNGLMAALGETKQRAIICMTMEREAVRPMPAGIAGYWLDGGVAVPLACADD